MTCFLRTTHWQSPFDIFHLSTVMATFSVRLDTRLTLLTFQSSVDECLSNFALTKEAYIFYIQRHDQSTELIIILWNSCSLNHPLYIMLFRNLLCFDSSSFCLYHKSAHFNIAPVNSLAATSFDMVTADAVCRYRAHSHTSWCWQQKQAVLIGTVCWPAAWGNITIRRDWPPTRSCLSPPPSTPPPPSRHVGSKVIARTAGVVWRHG
jgi:hypothetical protein